MRYAVEQNYRIRNSRLDTRIAGEDLTAAYGDFLPSVSTTGALGIPTAESSWRFNNFTMEQYEAVHAKLMSGEIVVDNNSDNVNPEIEGITVNYVD